MIVSCRSGWSYAVAQVPTGTPLIGDIKSWKPPTSHTLRVSSMRTNVAPAHIVSARLSISALARTSYSSPCRCVAIERLHSGEDSLILRLPDWIAPILLCMFRLVCPCFPKCEDAADNLLSSSWDVTFMIGGGGGTYGGGAAAFTAPIWRSLFSPFGLSVLGLLLIFSRP